MIQIAGNKRAKCYLPTNTHHLHLSPSPNLVQRHVIRIKIILSRIDRRLIVHTLHFLTISPVRPQRPRTQLRILSLVVTCKMGRIERLRGSPILDPIDHDSKVGLREGTVRLHVIGSAVQCTGDEEEAVPVRRIVPGYRWPDTSY